MKLTDNFTLAELCDSDTALRRNFTEQFTPSRPVIDNLEKLAREILQPLRNIIGPFRVTSGYRCPRLNAAVGGVADSAHVKGLAADIPFRNKEEAIRIVESLIAIGAKRIGLHRSFIHVDLDYSKPTPAIFNYGNNTPLWLESQRTRWRIMMTNKQQ